MRLICLLIISIFFFLGCNDAYIKKMNSLNNEIMSSIYSEDSNNIAKYEEQSKLYKEKFQFDEVKSIDSREFSQNNGKLGLWIPVRFLHNIGGGIYFLEKFDKNKIPILLVHGAGGYPYEWKSIIKKLDREKYQPVVAFYPSGFSLSLSTEVIYEALEKIIKKYEINKMIVIAHSMGGLVSRNLISQLLKKDNELVKTFISISTPWNGHESAQGSMKTPYTIPSWLDMVPNSKFLKKIQSIKFPSDFNHYLLFGYKGKITLYGRDNDGTVSLQSQLNWNIQNKASKVYGFNENHTSILRSKELIKKINNLLNN